MLQIAMVTVQRGSKEQLWWNRRRKYTSLSEFHSSCNNMKATQMNAEELKYCDMLNASTLKNCISMSHYLKRQEELIPEAPGS